MHRLKVRIILVSGVGTSCAAWIGEKRKKALDLFLKLQNVCAQRRETLNYSQTLGKDIQSQNDLHLEIPGGM